MIWAVAFINYSIVPIGTMGFTLAKLKLLQEETMVKACNVERERLVKWYEDIMNGVKYEGKIFRKGEVVTIRTKNNYVTRGKIVDITQNSICIEPSYSGKEEFKLESILSIMR